MTTLILAQRKMFAAWPLSGGRAAIRYSELNARGGVTTFLLTLTGVALVAYVGALYMTFNFGFAMQKSAKLIAATQAQVLDAELAVRTREAHLVERHPAVLESMQKISNIKYLSSESFVSYSR